MQLLILIAIIVGGIYLNHKYPGKPLREQRIDEEARAMAKANGDATYIGSRGERRATKNGHVAAYRPIKNAKGEVIGREVCDVSKHGLPGAPVVDREYGKTFLG